MRGRESFDEASARPRDGDREGGGGEQRVADELRLPDGTGVQATETVAVGALAAHEGAHDRRAEDRKHHAGSGRRADSGRGRQQQRGHAELGEREQERGRADQAAGNPEARE